MKILLARAITTAGVALAVGLVAVPSASAVVREAGRTVEAAKSAAGKTAAENSSAQNSSAQSAAAAQNPASRPLTINVYYVMQDGRVVSEQGPGDTAAHEIDGNSGAVDMQTQNEPITTGDLNAKVDGKQRSSPVNFEVEGSEQDTGEVS